MSTLLTTQPVPVRPPNLAQALQPWLARLGFVLTQQDNHQLTQLEATWTDAGGQQFVLSYVHYHPADAEQLALGSLHVRPTPGAVALCLVAATHIRKASEVRLLLLANCRYKTARQAALAAATHSPAHA